MYPVIDTCTILAGHHSCSCFGGVVEVPDGDDEVSLSLPIGASSKSWSCCFMDSGSPRAEGDAHAGLILLGQVLRVVELLCACVVKAAHGVRVAVAGNR
jgi:hypothetical protein